MTVSDTKCDDLYNQIDAELSYTPPEDELKTHIRYYHQLGLSDNELTTALTSVYQIRNLYLNQLAEEAVLSDDSLILQEDTKSLR